MKRPQVDLPVIGDDPEHSKRFKEILRQIKQPLSEQSRRFIETARELGVDETSEAFERAFGKIVPPKRPKPKDETPEPKSRKPRK